MKILQCKKDLYTKKKNYNLTGTETGTLVTLTKINKSWELKQEKNS